MSKLNEKEFFELIGNSERLSFSKGDWIAERKSENQICHLIKTGEKYTIHVYDSKYGISELESWNNAKLIEIAPKMYRLLEVLKERLNYFNDKVSINEIDELISIVSIIDNKHCNVL